MPSALAGTTKSLPVAFAKAVAKARDAALSRRDPKVARVSERRSSDGHTMMDLLERVPLELIVEVLHRWLKAVKRQERAAERQKARRAKQQRAKRKSGT